MCSELPKEFQKTTEVLPFNEYGLSSLEEFQKVEDGIQRLEWLKKAGLDSSEIKLYQDNEFGKLDLHKNVEAEVLKGKLKEIYKKINKLSKADESFSQDHEEPNISNSDKSVTKQDSEMYPEGHPMNNIKDLEENLFSHLQQDMLPISKRRKMLRHLERRKERILSKEKQMTSKSVISEEVKPGSLWDVKKLPHKSPVKKTKEGTDREEQVPSTSNASGKSIGPKKQTMYTVKDKKIVRLEPVNDNADDEYRAVDIVVPVNEAEVQLLEGTKMTIDDIKKIDRFKDYEPGVPSKVLYLKNIAPPVTQEQISLLFNQFILDNGRPVDVRLMTGRMRGQAFVQFTNEDLAIQALEEINGTILNGRPVIVEFGRNTNRIQEDDVR